MNDIFVDKKIYPHEGKIKEHFKDFYDNVFVAFLPFFKVDNHKTDTNNFQRAKKITYEEAKGELEVLKNIPEFKADIYSYGNKDFPTDTEIYEKGKSVSWHSIIKGAGLKDKSELNKALRTSIGALRQVFRRPELTEKLNGFTTTENIWHPTEGSFDVLSKLPSVGCQIFSVVVKPLSFSVSSGLRKTCLNAPIEVRSALFSSDLSLSPAPFIMLCQETDLPFS